MADEVRLVATKDIPKGFKTRPAAGGAYHTRMLKAGEEFYTATPIAKFFVQALKRAEEAREVGRVAAPPQRLVQKVVESTPAKVEEPAEEPRPVAAVSTRTLSADKPKTTRRRTTRKSTAKK